MLTDKELDQLVSSSSEEAVQIVRGLGNSSDELKLKADTFIDAGIVLNRASFIRAGIFLLRKETRLGNGTSAHFYSLANGLSAYTEIYDGIHQSNDFRAKLDAEARAYYGNVLTAKDFDFQLRSQAATNIANHLNKRGRYVEASGYYCDALKVLPVNAVAAAGELSLLKRIGFQIHHEEKWYRFYGDFHSLLRRTATLRDVIKDNLDVLVGLAGSDHIPYALGLIEHTPDYDLPNEIKIEGDYERWIDCNRLALSLFCSGEEYNSRRYDLLILPSFTAEDGSDECRPPDIFRMINIIKSDYLLARRLAFDALNESYTETANYSDTLDYATYGINVSALANSQKLAIDILDKISVAIATLLNLPSPEFFQFKKQAFWRKKSPDQWILKHSEVEAQISKGNEMMSVFLDVISDLYDKEDGYLSHLTFLRNFSTHKFLSVHDFSLAPGMSESTYVSHFQQSDLSEGVLKSLSLARACIFYLIDFIKFLEDQKQQDGALRVPLEVPDHHYIRGNK
jgi:hypothetical protein